MSTTEKMPIKRTPPVKATTQSRLSSNNPPTIQGNNDEQLHPPAYNQVNDNNQTQLGKATHLFQSELLLKEHDDQNTPMPQSLSVASVKDKNILSQLLTETDQCRFTKTLLELSQKYHQAAPLPLGDVQSSSKLSKNSVNVVSKPLCNNRGKGSINFAQGPLSNDYNTPKIFMLSTGCFFNFGQMSI